MNPQGPYYFTHTTNGVTRVLRAKQIGTTLRVYAVHGEATRRQDLLEMAQEIAIEHGLTEVQFRFPL